MGFRDEPFDDKTGDFSVPFPVEFLEQIEKKEPGLYRIVNKEIRVSILDMLDTAQSGHTGGSLSGADILTALYFGDVMKYNPKNPDWKGRDYFILSAGHKVPALYAVLKRAGYTVEDLKYLRKISHTLQGHPHPGVPGVELATGSLGQGLSVAVGIASDLKYENLDNRVYCLLGDGEIQEGQIWEAARDAAAHNLDNMCAILDHNGLQIDGNIADVSSPYPIADKWKAYGWHVIGKEKKLTDRELDEYMTGHDFIWLLRAFYEAKQTGEKPTIIIANTVKGKGVPEIENDPNYHGKVISHELHQKSRGRLLNV